MTAARRTALKGRTLIHRRLRGAAPRAVKFNLQQDRAAHSHGSEAMLLRNPAPPDQSCLCYPRVRHVAGVPAMPEPLYSSQCQRAGTVRMLRESEVVRPIRLSASIRHISFACGRHRQTYSDYVPMVACCINSASCGKCRGYSRYLRKCRNRIKNIFHDELVANCALMSRKSVNE